jgi:hypothetical protein
MYKVIIGLLLSFFASHVAFGQNTQRTFPQMMQTYYLYKDKNLVDETINFCNNTTMDYERMQPILTGFFGALFASDRSIRKECVLKIKNITNPSYKDLFSFLTSANIDSIYRQTPLSPAYNDMNWSSYFATGDTKYLENIITNTHLAENREDRNLFLTGASAKWSLCSNAL